MIIKQVFNLKSGWKIRSPRLAVCTGDDVESCGGGKPPWNAHCLPGTELSLALGCSRFIFIMTISQRKKQAQQN